MVVDDCCCWLVVVTGLCCWLWLLLVVAAALRSPGVSTSSVLRYSGLPRATFLQDPLPSVRTHREGTPGFAAMPTMCVCRYGRGEAAESKAEDELRKREEGLQDESEK